MRTLAETLRDWGGMALDALMPPRARSARTKERGLSDIPLSPTEHELLGVSITTLMDYRLPAAQDLIRALKYDASGHAARLSAGVLAEYLFEELSDQALFTTSPALLVPLPLHKSRARERGYNQIELVLRALPREFRDGTRALLAPTLLARTRATPPQTKLSRAERIKNVAGAFTADRAHVDGARVYLIDDVTTTGATLLHAGRALEEVGAVVSRIALARA